MARLGSIERTALGVLRRRLGWRRSFAVGLRTQRRMARGEPFDRMPRPEDARERASRAQAGAAVILYEELRAVVHEAEALSITAEVVEACAVDFLQSTLGPLRRADLEGLSEAARRAFVEERGARFPNAVPVWEEVSADRVRFAVARCRLVELVRAVGHPELAPLFCQGDARFFGTTQPEVTLDRPTTLASGADRCAFTLRFAPPPEDRP